MARAGPVAVTNSGPLILLHEIGRLPLLAALFRSVVVPDAVWREAVADGSVSADAMRALEVVRVERPLSQVQGLSRKLHDGEREVLALAREIGADVVLIDEIDARRAARGLGLRVQGSLGLLVDAKRAGHLPAVRPEIDRAVAAGARLSPRVIAEALRAAGEAVPGPE